MGARYNMAIYIVLMIVWGALGLISRGGGVSPIGQDYRSPRWGTAASGLCLFLVMALRHPSVGTDLPQYQWQYEVEYFRSEEIGYSALASLSHALSLSFQQFLAVIAFIIAGSVTLLFCQLALNPFLSFYLHLTIGLFAMSLSGLRQSLAAAILILAFLALIRRGRIAFLLLVATAFTFHNSAIVFLPLVLIRGFRISRARGLALLALVTAVAATVSLLDREAVLIAIEWLKLSQYERFLDASRPSPVIVTVLVSGLIPVACLAVWRENRVAPSAAFPAGIDVASLLLLLSIANFGLALAFADIYLMDRLTYYFTSFNCVLIPNVILSARTAFARGAGLAAAVALPLVQFMFVFPQGALGIDSYRFFWE